MDFLCLKENPAQIERRLGLTIPAEGEMQLKNYILF